MERKLKADTVLVTVGERNRKDSLGVHFRVERYTDPV